jgi:hypothetical protein
MDARLSADHIDRRLSKAETWVDRMHAEPVLGELALDRRAPSMSPAAPEFPTHNTRMAPHPREDHAPARVISFEDGTLSRMGRVRVEPLTERYRVQRLAPADWVTLTHAVGVAALVADSFEVPVP